MRTTVTNGLKAQRPANLIANLPCGQASQAWCALAEIGRQLQILAGAQMGQGNFSAHASPPLLIYPPDSPTVVELTNEFLKAKARANRSDRYLAALHYSLRKFTAGRSHKPAAEISCGEIENWLHALHVAPRTQRGYLGDVRTMFNFGVRRGLLKLNPAAGVELPEVKVSAVTIHTPDVTRRSLDFARAYDLDICRALAIRYFAGLRTVEAERADESLIGEKYFNITPAVAKDARARRRRLVTIQPNLRAWLNLGGSLPAPKQNGRRMLEFMRAMTAAGIDWPHNVTRHSFCTYHLAKFQDARQTALQAGHTEQMLFSNYREVVTPEAGEEFFSIVP